MELSGSWRFFVRREWQWKRLLPLRTRSQAPCAALVAKLPPKDPIRSALFVISHASLADAVSRDPRELGAEPANAEQDSLKQWQGTRSHAPDFAVTFSQRAARQTPTKIPSLEHGFIRYPLKQRNRYCPM